MHYNDFRPRALLAVSLMILFSITFLSAVELMQSIIIWNVSNPWIFVNHALIKNCAIGIPTILVFCIWFYQYLGPINGAFATLASGKQLAKSGEELAKKNIRKMRRVLLAGNYFAYGISAIVSILQGGFASLISPTGIIQICIYLIMSAIAAILETSIILRIIAAPRKMLAIHTIGEGDTETGLRQRLILTNGCLVLLVMVFLLFSSMSTVAKDSLYTQCVEKIALGDVTVAEAEQEYKESGAKIVHVPPESIPFSLSAQTSGSRSARALEGSLLLILSLLIITYAVEKVSADETVRQVNDVSSKLKEMLAGSGDLTKRIEITQFDEVGHLVSDLNGLIDSLQKTFLDVQKTSLMALDSAASLGKEIIVTSEVSEELAAGVTQVARNVDMNLNRIETTGKNLAEVFKSLDNIILSVDTQAAFVNQTSGAVSEMAANVKSVSTATIRANGLANQLSKAASDGNTAVTNSIQAIRKVEEASKKVTEMVSVISQIASQTNLLAMNAAIEAAHAGDAGKGFAVVANEVRGLAESSAKSAKQITVQIKTMLETVHNGVALSETAGVALDSISTDIQATTGLVKQIADAMTEQSLAANDILSSITSLVEETQSIKNNAMEQKRRNDVVSANVQQNTESIREIAQVTKEQTEDAKLILKSIFDLKEIEKKNAEMAANLSSLVSGFKLS